MKGLTHQLADLPQDMESVAPSEVDQEALALFSQRKDKEEVMVLTLPSLGHVKFLLENYPLSVAYNVVCTSQTRLITHPPRNQNRPTFNMLLEISTLASVPECSRSLKRQ